MTQILHIDSSPRLELPGRAGSHTRRLSARFVSRWLAASPESVVRRRDVGLSPPAFVDAAFVEAAFVPVSERDRGMQRALAESDTLVDELLASELIVAGVPMHNFGPPAHFKAYIDNVVRVGRSFGFDRAREPPSFPLLPAGKTLVILSARGDYGYEHGERAAHMNHVEPSIRTAYIGISDVRSIAIEYGEFPRDPRHAESIARAEAQVDALVDQLLAPAQQACGARAGEGCGSLGPRHEEGPVPS
jgi:FMN-dependent NADH-azoreductase